MSLFRELLFGHCCPRCFRRFVMPIDAFRGCDAPGRLATLLCEVPR